MKDSDPKLAMRAGVIEVRAAEGDVPASVRMSVSSEEPVLTYGYFNDQYQRIYEILDHGEGSINMSRCKDGLVILDRHYGDQIGLMTVDTKDRKLGGVVEFCTGNRAQEIGKDAAKGLRRNVSVGYTVAAESYRLEGDKDGLPVVRAMSWMPYEASFEPVPADTSVGVGRTNEWKPTAEVPATRKEKNKMDPKELAKLFERAASNGIEAAKVLELVEAGKGRAELDALIVEKQRVEIKELKERKPDVPIVDGKAVIVGKGELGLSEKETRRYSMLRVIQAQLGGKADIGFERECSEAVAKQLGRTARGFFVPWDVMVQKRDMQIVSAGTGSNFVATNLLVGSFIEAIRARSILPRLGVPVISGLVGDIAIPKMSAITGYWIAETAEPTESTPVMSQVTGTPRTVAGTIDYSRKLAMQSSLDVEMLIQNDLAKALAQTIDKAGFNGAGTSEPTGLLTGPISTDCSVTAGTPTFAEIANIMATVEDKIDDIENGKWAVTGEVFWKLATTATSAGSSVFVADYNTSRILGAMALRSGNVTANYGVFGDWTQMVMGMWGNGLDLRVDPYSGSKSGLVSVTGFMDVDVMVRNAEGFAHADITT
jgi:HK97 family phage major capsid protein